MKSLLELTTAHEIKQRIERLTPQSEARWGKMNVGQMMAHCSIALELYLTGTNLKRPFIGILFGPIAKKRMLTDKPWAKNLPTARELHPTAATDFDKEKERLLQLLAQFDKEGGKVTPIKHPFFGKMTTADWGLHQYKHLDHHLTQFGA